MKEEILAAVMFFIRFIEKSDKFPQDQIENFKKHLTELLMERFEKHWFPELPTKGQAYRCIRINGVSPIDLTLERAASKCGSSYSDLRLPTELTVWVDPSEVCYRLGESEGSYCTLATFPSENRSSSSENSTPNSTPPSTPLQEKLLRKVQRPPYQRYSTDFPNKYRNPQNMFISPFRVKTAHEGNFNLGSNRQLCRGSYPTNPPFYKNMNMNRTHYKNVCRV
ncbi:protein BTG1 [Tribolium castaneum]|uniref:Protein BTG3-like Protein n=1 Tax=Tribolium castaneum TaxID=7070 RepID=D6WFR0_TRICA|nr:PREDICTED: protein BTG1 [Tribolium castaneum]EEZ99582.2 Protein BTG3-like Protein [Tribolium castaneum]|eukprot:XP_967468.1 PREDICTED: protein BTG1 [Tribolium castaneum]